MVRATLREIDPKTMTRRVVKTPKRLQKIGWSEIENGPICSQTEKDCPYGKIGDRLWVREAWKTGSNLDKFNAAEIQYQAEDAGYFRNNPKCPIFYPADNRHLKWGESDISDFGAFGRHRHARFMPRWASRILLKITNIRVERLQDISEEDAKAEGVYHSDGKPDEFGMPTQLVAYARGEFFHLWEKINGKKYPVDSNPWVWVIEFKRITP